MVLLLVLNFRTDGSTTTGIFTKESSDLYAIQLAYAADSYGLLLLIQIVIHLPQIHLLGIKRIYTFGSVIDSVSVGYETGNPTSATDDTSNWFAGVTTGDIGPGTINLGVGTVGHTTSSADELLLYEVSYGWDINDSMSATAGIFQEEELQVLTI